MPKRKLVIIADDLTGAMDASGYLAGRGLRVTVTLGQKFGAGTDVIVISTNSRRDPPPVASKKLRDVAARVKGHILFKKIDSTLRGNIGPEIAAMADTVSCEKVIVAPAFPALGRTVRNGDLLVNGMPVAETEFRHDPLFPVKDSSILSLFKLEANHPVGLVKLEDVARGPEYLSREFIARAERILVCDTAEQEQLRCIAEAAVPLADRLLLGGSGGLAREMHIMLAGSTRKAESPVPDPLAGPLLFVVGSRHPVTAGQLLKARDGLGLRLLEMEADSLADDAGISSEISRLVSGAAACFTRGVSVAVTSAFTKYLPDMARVVDSVLAETTRAILQNHQVSGLFLSGGDTAVSVCNKLDISEIRVYGETQPGIPAGKFIGRWGGLRVVTKAGAFGEEDAIIKAVPYLERGIL